MAHGICDNLLLAVYLSAKCPVAVAPAMDLDMWKHPSTQRNINTLKQDGVKVIPVGEGELASGLNGEGRLAEPDEILTFIQHEFFKR
jgi:phosphopantothenoylcysteine decarboxylase/phosphopantothenate--cysteine ligase